MTKINQTPRQRLVSIAASLLKWSPEATADETGESLREAAYEIRRNADAMQKEIERLQLVEEDLNKLKDGIEYEQTGYID